jgi:hypothetical protein
MFTYVAMFERAMFVALALPSADAKDPPQMPVTISFCTLVHVSDPINSESGAVFGTQGAE